MDLKATLGQLLALFVVVDVSDISGYIPKIASISTNVTDKAFVLVQPNCIFNQYPTTNVWLVVAGNTAHVNLNDLALGTPVPYSSFKNGSSNYYHTFFLPATQYPCSLNSSTSMNLLQIGCETGCTENSFCNGPLSNNSNPYRAKFILLNSTGIDAETNWSTEINLTTGKSYNTDLPFSRSGGMIALTTILCVLMAILLICLIVALAVGSKNICWKQKWNNKDFLVGDFDHMTRGTYTSRYKNIYSFGE